MGIRIGEFKPRDLGLGGLIAVIYGLAFTGVWMLSVDQWYLPSGLRFSALLTVRKKHWPALFLGELGALLWLRQPYLPQYGLPWYLIASAVLFPVTAAVIWLVRPHLSKGWLTGSSTIARLLGSIIAAAAASKLVVVACLWGLAIPYAKLHAPSSVPGLMALSGRLPTLVLGDLLGILLFCPPAIFWIQRSQYLPLPTLHWRSLWTIPAFPLLIVAAANLNGEWRQAASYLLFVPAVSLTLSLGWPGAVLGTFLANLGTALAMQYQHGDGAIDPSMLPTQTVLVIFCMCILSLGAALTRHHAVAEDSEEKAERANNVAMKTMAAARAALQNSERDMHDRAQRAAAGHATWITTSRTMIERLRRIDPIAAMELTQAATMEARSFNGQILDALYPLRLESEGLYAVLRASTMLDTLSENGIKLHWRLIGNASKLSPEIKRMLYRAVIELVDHYARTTPEAIQLTVRCSSTTSRAGGIVVVHATGGKSVAQDQRAIESLHTRVEIYGGSMKQNERRTAILFIEPTSSVAARAA